MKLGLIARADVTGLGNQTKMYFDWLKPVKTLVVDFTDINRRMGKTATFYPEKFPGARISKGYPSHADLAWLLESVDVVLTAETPYNHDLFTLARDKGVKTFLHYNFEFLGNLQDRLPLPDVLLAPTMWRADEVKRLAQDNNVRWEYLPLGVDRQELPFRLRKRAEMFVHIVGQAAHRDRNGTVLLLDALRHVSEPVNLKIYSQSYGFRLPQFELPGHIKLQIIKQELPDYRQLYNDGDVLVFPRKYGGQSLVLNEAISSGMAVLMTDCGPQNEFLHPKSLIPARHAGTLRAKAVIDAYEAEPEAIAAKIDELARTPSLAEELSRHSDKLARPIDWRNLAKSYTDMLGGANGAVVK